MKNITQNQILIAIGIIVLLIILFNWRKLFGQSIESPQIITNANGERILRVRASDYGYICRDESGNRYRC